MVNSSLPQNGITPYPSQQTTPFVVVGPQSPGGGGPARTPASSGSKATGWCIGPGDVPFPWAGPCPFNSPQARCDQLPNSGVGVSPSCTGDAVGNAAGGITHALSGPFDALGNFFSLLSKPTFWKYTALILAGSAALVIGLFVWMRQE